jgi:hydrogenase maturation factor
MRVIEEGVDGVALCCTDEGVASEVMTDLVGAVARGDAVLVHAGVALTRLA